MHKSCDKTLVALPKILWYTVINLCNSHKALPVLKGDIMKEKKLGAKVKAWSAGSKPTGPRRRRGAMYRTRRSPLTAWAVSA